MGKKKQRAKYTSKGQRVNTDLGVAKAVKRDRSFLDKESMKLAAFCAGKKVYFTIPNPSPKNTRERFIRVEGSAIYGDYRKFVKFPSVMTAKE